MRDNPHRCIDSTDSKKFTRLKYISTAPQSICRLQSTVSWFHICITVIVKWNDTEWTLRIATHMYSEPRGIKQLISIVILASNWVALTFCILSCSSFSSDVTYHIPIIYGILSCYILFPKLLFRSIFIYQRISYDAPFSHCRFFSVAFFIAYSNIIIARIHCISYVEM